MTIWDLKCRETQNEKKRLFFLDFLFIIETEKKDGGKPSAYKNTTQVLIGGKIVKLSGYESEEYLQKVAAYLNHKLAELVNCLATTGSL